MNRKYELVPLKAWHLDYLAARGPATGGGIPFDSALAERLAEMFSWTTLYTSEPVACGGLIEIWPHRFGAWSYINECAGPHMLAVTRHARWIFAQKKGRIEMQVREDFEAGHRWAELLGFRVESPSMLLYGNEGETHVGYVRIN